MGAPEQVGRYAIFDRIAAGGMASVHLGRLFSEGGFSRTVAIKRLHPQFAMEPEFVAAFLDEARLAARIRHPNVVPTLDVGLIDGQLFLVMEYVEGESFSRLCHISVGREGLVPWPIASSILVNVLHGLHAAHEAKGETGNPLNLVHRDVSPQNVLVGTDGVARVLDFGIAKAVSQLHNTQKGQRKGKLSYMAPEQLLSLEVTRQADVFSASVLLWEALTGQRLFRGDGDLTVIQKVTVDPIARPRAVRPDLPEALDAVVMRGLERDPALRFATAEEMATALEDALAPATARRVGAWVRELASRTIDERAQRVRIIESNSADHPSRVPPPVEALVNAWASMPPPAEPRTGSGSHPTSPPLASSAPPSKPRMSPAGQHRAAISIAVVLGSLITSAAFFLLHRAPSSAPMAEATHVSPSPSVATAIVSAMPNNVPSAPPTGVPTAVDAVAPVVTVPAVTPPPPPPLAKHPTISAPPAAALPPAAPKKTTLYSRD